MGDLGVLRSSLVPTIDKKRDERIDFFVLGRYINFNCRTGKRLTPEELLHIAKEEGSLTFLKPFGLFGRNEYITEYGSAINGVLLGSETSLEEDRKTRERIKELHESGLHIPKIEVSGAHTIKGTGRQYIDITEKDLPLEHISVWEIGKAIETGNYQSGPINLESPTTISKLKVIFGANEIKDRLLGLNDRYGLRKQKSA